MSWKNSSLWLLAVAGGLFAAAGITKQTKRRRLAGKVVLLTGGSRGLGLQLARELAKEQCKLILVARSNAELDLAREDLRARGADAEVIPSDLTKPDDIGRMLIEAQAIHGRIDIVINNAGRIDVAPIDSLEEENFHAALDLMLWAPVRIVLSLLPTLLKSGDADIVNISSIGGKIAVPHMLPYSTAKFSLCGFSEGLDAEVRTRGVHVLTVTPGLLRTGSHKQAVFAGQTEAEYRWFALGATIPGISMEVDRAAHQIVAALKARRRSLTLTWSAQVAMRLHGAFPTPAMFLMTYMNKFLPKAVNNKATQSGRELELHQSRLFRAITSLGDSAAESQNENVL